MKSNDIRVIRDQRMMSELATLILLLTRAGFRSEQTLDCIIDGMVSRG
jgi:hypothetical protein